MNTQEFLALFQHEKYTLGYLNGKGMRTFPCNPQNIDKALNLLTKRNIEDNAEIYFTPNEGNGQLNDSKTACHSTKNVTNLSAVFLDAERNDGTDPLPDVLAFCLDHFESPSIIVNTSPNRYHIYWLLEPAAVTKESVYKWKQLQAFLHSKLSDDTSMTDLPQLLRLPNFKNTKKDFQISVTSSTQNRYALGTLYKILSTQFPELKPFKPHEPLPLVTESYQVSPGNRHEEILRRARKLYEAPGITDEDVKCYVHGFIQAHVQDSNTFLPGGKRYQETLRSLEAAKTYYEASKLEEQQTTVTKAVQKHTSKKSPHELDPDFYYQAPGLVGELTRHIVDTSKYPLPAHAFAAATSIVGFTKARYVQGTRQLPPLNYFLCLAPSGAGKTSIQNVIKEVLTKLQIRQFLEDGIASAQGVLQFLSNSHGLGFILYDEVKDLFQTIQSKNAHSYESRIAIELTKLYTAYGSDYTPPTTKTHKGAKVILNKPLFAFLGYGHHTLVDNLFTKQNVLEGLIPRFIILQVDERNQTSNLYKPVPTHILDELRHHTLKSCLVLEDILKDTPPDQPPTQTPNIEIFDLSPPASILYSQFEQSTNVLYDQAVAERNGLEALFSRGCEQSLRISLAMSSQVNIDAQTMQFSITLIDSQMRQFYQIMDSTVNQTQVSKEINSLYDTIVKLCAESSTYTISKRDLQRKVQNRYNNTRSFHDAIKELEDQERIKLFPNPSKKGQILIKLDDV